MCAYKSRWKGSRASARDDRVAHPVCVEAHLGRRWRGRPRVLAPLFARARNQTKDGLVRFWFVWFNTDGMPEKQNKQKRTKTAVSARSRTDRMQAQRFALSPDRADGGLSQSQRTPAALMCGVSSPREDRVHLPCPRYSLSARVPGGTRQNDGLGTGIVGAAAAT